jgi:hypothetical protein
MTIPEEVLYLQEGEQCQDLCQTREAKVSAQLTKEQLKEAPFHLTPKAHTKLAEKANTILVLLPAYTYHLLLYIWHMILKDDSPLGVRQLLQPCPI